MQVTSATDGLQLTFNADYTLLQEAAIRLDLRFAWAAHEAAAAALPLQVGPAANKPAALIFEMSEVNLQTPLFRPRATSENLEYQTGAVEHLGLELALQIPLLNRGKLMVNDDELRARLGHDIRQILDLARTDQRCRPRLRDREKLTVGDLEIDCLGKPYSLVQFGLRRKWYMPPLLTILDGSASTRRNARRYDDSLGAR
jgi:hypothetical protein